MLNTSNPPAVRLDLAAFFMGESIRRNLDNNESGGAQARPPDQGSFCSFLAPRIAFSAKMRVRKRQKCPFCRKWQNGKKQGVPCVLFRHSVVACFYSLGTASGSSSGSLNSTKASSNSTNFKQKSYISAATCSSSTITISSVGTPRE